MGTGGRSDGAVALTDPAFDTLHALARARDRSAAAALRLALTRPRQCLRAARVLARLPRRTLPAPVDRSGRELLGAVHGERRKRGWPFTTVPVLMVPPAGVTYSSGRSRQALRTNTRRAEAAGITCAAVNAAQFAALLQRLAPTREWTAPDELAALRSVTTDDPHRRLFAAQAGDRPAVLAKVVVRDGEARLDLFVRDPSLPASSEARYALMAVVVEELQRLDVRLLLVTNVLELEPGVRYFAHLVGFAPVSVRVGGARNARAAGNAASG